MLSRGDQLGARFRLVDKIGEGGMGVVWLARDEKLECDVAIKVLHAALLGDEHAAARLRNEARAAAKVAHPGICRVLDVGEHEDTPFLVMELLRGHSLAALMESQKRLSAERAVGIAESVLDALATAHSEGVLHRDLKPENVFLCDDGGIETVKVLDFGVAKILDDAVREKLTRTGALIGTPAYMAPEQARGLPSGERADLWSVGVILFEMLSGKLPYEASNYQGMLVAIATNTAPSIRERCPSLDAELVAIVDRALSTDLEARWPDARSFADALSSWRIARGITRAPVAATPSAHLRRAPRRSPREQAILTMTDPDRAARRSKLFAVVAAVTVSSVALIAWRAMARTSERVGTPSFHSAPDSGARPSAIVAERDAGAADAPERDAMAPSDVVAVGDAADAAISVDRARIVASDGGRGRARRGRRPDGGASTGIGRDPDF